ncbi:hypothetical protein DYH09_26140 [bacterium CPR1]|nr:hypothetical protein [bacterium CPR1]
MSPRQWMAVLLLAALILAGGLIVARRVEQAAPRETPVAPYRLPLLAPGTREEIKQLKARAPLDRAALARAYLARARETRDPAMYLLAEENARLSLKGTARLNPSAELVLAHLEVARHDFKRALERIARILDQDPAQHAARALKATALLALGQVKPASELADQLALQQPGLTSTVLRAQTLVARGLDEEAARELWKGIDREQAGETLSSQQARVLLSRLYARHGKLRLAEAVLGSALTLGRDPAALAELGRVDLSRKRWNAAREHFAESYALGRDPSALQGVALALEGLRLGREAAETRQRVEEAYRRELEGQQQMGHRRALAGLLLERGDSREAVELMQAELALRRDFETLMTAARALRQAGRPEDGWALMEEAFAQGYRDAPAWRERAALAEALKRPEEVARCREEALRINPVALPELPSPPVEH